MLRVHSSQEILKKAQKILARYKNIHIKNNNEFLYKELSAFVPQAGIVGHDIEIGISTTKDEDAFKALARLRDALKHIKGVIDISDNAKVGPSELKLQINNYGKKLGFNESNLLQILRGLYLDAEYGKMFNQKGLIRIHLEDSQRNLNINLKALRVRTPNGKQSVALGEITNFIYKRSMLKLYKEDGQRVWSITARTQKKIILPSEVMQKVSPLIKELRSEGVKVIIKGEEKENRQVKKEMSEAGILAIFLIFISLVLMFNSLILPLLTISVIPLSMLGALLGNWVMGLNLSLPGVMGIVGLAGVVVNDALIMLDFIKDSKDYNQLSKRASMRLRPIFLTSLTTVLGLLTLMFFASGQALIIQPMAVSLGYGVAWATVLNLIYIPLLYAVVYRVKEKK